MSQSDLTQFLKDMADHPHYPAFVEEVAKARPVIGRYRPDDELSVEKWKLASGLQQGYDRFASLMKLRIIEEDT